LDDALIVDDVLGYGQKLVPRDDRLLVNGAAYQRRGDGTRTASAR